MNTRPAPIKNSQAQVSKNIAPVLAVAIDFTFFF
jgi:hypothetical protein